jgi:hypothetical protein
LRKTLSRRKFWSETESLCACSCSIEKLSYLINILGSSFVVLFFLTVGKEICTLSYFQVFYNRRYNGCFVSSLFTWFSFTTLSIKSNIKEVMYFFFIVIWSFF